MVEGSSQPTVSQGRDVLKVTHVSTADNLGGAARSAYRLHKGLLKVGHTSRMWVGYKSVESSEIHGYISESPLGKRMLHRLVFELADCLCLQYVFPWPLEVLNHPFVRSADIINLHNTHGNYFSHTLLPLLSKSHRIVWTLHDMWPLTGHCAYSYDCGRWKTGCGHCPILSDYPALPQDTTALLWRVKKWLYARSDLTIVAPSRWLADLARQSPLLGRFNVHHIPYGLDLEVFSPLPQKIARELLGLPQGIPLILFGAQFLKERRKGTTQFLDALRSLIHRDHYTGGVVTLGAGGSELELPRGLAWFHLGSISDDRLLRAAYSAADVFVCASPVDNLPNTVLESLACGVPVVAFNIGGIPDMVSHLETGYLASPNDTTDLAAGIRLLLENRELGCRLGQSARRKAECEYGLTLQAKRYEDLYYSMLSEREPIQIRNAVRV